MSLQQEENTEKYLNLGHTQAENHARTQQKLYEEYVAQTSSVTRRIEEFFKTNIIGFGWHYMRSRFGKRHPYQYYPSQGDSGIYKFHPTKTDGQVTLALLSDWANDTKEADEVAHRVAWEAPDYTIHLGDIYFVGSPQEVEENFTAPHASWYYGKSGSLALPVNHEMYSNGDAFFNHLLPAMYATSDGYKVSQKAGFFCLENEYWRVIGLDTAYTSVGRPFLEVLFPPDGHLRKEQVEWLQHVVNVGDHQDRRGLIFLSHHPILSGYRNQYLRPAQQIAELLSTAKRPVIWFWGHEHRLIGYQFQEVIDGLHVYGRCIGIGGMPVELDLPKHEKDRKGLLFYDRRVRKTIGRHRVGYNGFATLAFENARVTATYKDSNGEIILEESWQVDLNKGSLTWQLNRYNPEMEPHIHPTSP